MGPTRAKESAHRHRAAAADRTGEEADAAVAVAHPADAGGRAVDHVVPAAHEELDVHRPEGLEIDPHLRLPARTGGGAQGVARKGALANERRTDADDEVRPLTEVLHQLREGPDRGGIGAEAVPTVDLEGHPRVRVDVPGEAAEELGAVRHPGIAARERRGHRPHLGQADLEAGARHADRLGVLGVLDDRRVDRHVRRRHVHDRGRDVDDDRPGLLRTQRLGQLRDLRLERLDLRGVRVGLRGGGGGGRGGGRGGGGLGRGGLRGAGLRGRLRLGRGRGLARRLRGALGAQLGELGLEGLALDGVAHDLGLEKRGVEGGAVVGVGGEGEGQEQGEHRIDSPRPDGRWFGSRIARAGWPT